MDLGVILRNWYLATPSLLEKTKQKTMVGWHGNVYVESVYDGDTFKAIIPGYGLKSVRVYGIDTPEKRSRNKSEKKASIAVRDIVRAMFAKVNHFVFVYITGMDKYGRCLCKVVLKGICSELDNETGKVMIKKKDYHIINLSGWLIRNGLALAYDGGTKTVYPEGSWNERLTSDQEFQIIEQ